MEIGELATATGGTTGGLYLLYRIERLVAAALAKRNGKPASACGSSVADTLERSAVIQERTAEVLDQLHDSMTSVREGQAIILRTIEREVIPKLKP